MTLYHGPLYIVLLNIVAQKWSTKIEQMMKGCFQGCFSYVNHLLQISTKATEAVYIQFYNFGNDKELKRVEEQFRLKFQMKSHFDFEIFQEK